MEKFVSKSKFKPYALKYFREIEQNGKALIITDRGKPVLKVIPYTKYPEENLKLLRNSVIKNDDPTAAVGVDDLEFLK